MHLITKIYVTKTKKKPDQHLSLQKITSNHLLDIKGKVYATQSLTLLPCLDKWLMAEHFYLDGTVPANGKGRQGIKTVK